MNICQKCHTLNPDLATCCIKCGSILLPPIIPDNMRAEVGFMLDDDQLGRISSLEYNLRSSEKNVEELVDHVEKQSLNNLHLIVTVEKLIDTLNELGIIDKKAIQSDVNKEIKGQIFRFDQQMRLNYRRDLIRDAYSGKNRHRFNATLNQAFKLLYTNDHVEGMKFLRSALRMSPGNHYLLQTLAEVLFIMGNTSGALVQVKRLLKMYPSNKGALLLIALISVKKGRFSEAVQYLNAVNDFASSIFTIPFLFGVCYFLTGDFKSAGSKFKKAYAVQPTVELSTLTAMAYYLGGRPGKANIMIRKVPLNEDETGFSYFLSGLICRRLGWWRISKLHLMEAIKRRKEWKKVLRSISLNKKSPPPEVILFIEKLHEEFEKLMDLIISEIQVIE